jgi:hypothetical protein
MQILKITDWSELNQIEEECYNLALLDLASRSNLYDHDLIKQILSNGFEALSVYISPQTEQKEIISYLKSKLEPWVHSKAESSIDQVQEIADLLYEEIAKIAISFLRSISAQKIHLQLESVRENTCTRFHVDYNEYRLLYTYSGKTTEYLLNESVDRRYLGTRNEKRIQKKDTQIQVVHPNQIAILKGIKKSATRAIVHKSPIYDNHPRLLLRIDSNPMLHIHHEKGR